MKIRLYQVVLILAALIATPALFKYAAAHRTFSGVGGEALLVLVVALGCFLWEQGEELIKMLKEGEED